MVYSAFPHQLQHDPGSPVVLDIVGTGGDNIGSVNISTGACVVAAAAGGRVAKHGSRSWSSLCGSADVLEVQPDLLQNCHITYQLCDEHALSLSSCGHMCCDGPGVVAASDMFCNRQLMACLTFAFEALRESCVGVQALGVAVDLGPQSVARCVKEAGVGFMFAPRYHPAMAAVRQIRKDLGVSMPLWSCSPDSTPFACCCGG